jgi:hypothetical protein
MSIQVITKLNSRERARKTEEAKKWLQEQGEIPDTETLHKTLLEAHSLTQELMNNLLSHQRDEQATVKLATHIQELIQKIKI